MEKRVRVMYEDILVGQIYTNRGLTIDEALKLIGFSEPHFLFETGFDAIDYNNFRLVY